MPVMLAGLVFFVIWGADVRISTTSAASRKALTSQSLLTGEVDMRKTKSKVKEPLKQKN